jgi:NTE family protein
VLSNFPVAVFDRTDGVPPRWPTFGVRLSMRPGARSQTTEVRGTVSLALSLVETMLEACDAQHIDDPCVQARSVFVDTGGISPVDFGITDAQQEELLLAGHEAAGAFLAGWDWPRYLRRCRGFEEGQDT